MTPRMLVRGLAMLCLVGGASAAMRLVHAPTITPAYRWFGRVALRGQSPWTFQVIVPPGGASTPLTVELTGRYLSDYQNPPAQVWSARDLASRCASGAQGYVCDHTVIFSPQSLGFKHATLVVTDALGNQARAQLEGEGVPANCLPIVVFCNYAHFYSGVFGWRSVSNGPNSQETETVDVTISNGVANCTGGIISKADNRSITGTIVGPGLIAVEILPDPVYNWVYRITVACPSAAWPAQPDVEAIPSRPAELGHGEQSSDKQPLGMGRTLEEAFDGNRRLQGTIYVPGNDPANGVSGSLTVTWNIFRY